MVDAYAYRVPNPKTRHVPKSHGTFTGKDRADTLVVYVCRRCGHRSGIPQCGYCKIGCFDRVVADGRMRIIRAPVV